MIENDDQVLSISEGEKLNRKDGDSVLCATQGQPKLLGDRWIGKRVLAHSKTGSYFCILNSIHMEESHCYARVADAWMVDLGRQKGADSDFIKNCRISMITVQRIYGGREFLLGDITNIEVSDDVIKKIQRLVDEVNW